MKRSPAVAGQFYYEDPARLNQQVEQYINKKAGKENAVGILVPHAGLVYSGAVAGAVYSSIKFPKTFLMLGPNHRTWDTNLNHGYRRVGGAHRYGKYRQKACQSNSSEHNRSHNR